MPPGSRPGGIVALGRGPLWEPGDRMRGEPPDRVTQFGRGGRNTREMPVNQVMSEDSEARRRSAENWRADSVCRKHPTRWWFGGDHRETVLAKGLCAGCAVQVPCLEFALGRPELLGVWATTTPNERAAMRRAGGAPALETPADVAVPVAVPVEILVEAAVEAEVHFDIDIDLVFEGERDCEVERAPRRGGPRRGRAGARGLADGDELLTPAEAALRLGVTANTVTRWSRAGKIAAIHTVGGHRRFRCSEIERVLLAASVVAPASL
jgi:excisionase family DNA binding protein